jgi:hypothetical protein
MLTYLDVGLHNVEQNVLQHLETQSKYKEKYELRSRHSRKMKG